MTQNDLLEHALINRLENDLQEHEYEPLSECLQKLIAIPEAKEILINYLSDQDKDDWLEGKTKTRY